MGLSPLIRTLITLKLNYYVKVVKRIVVQWPLEIEKARWFCIKTIVLICVRTPVIIQFGVSYLQAGGGCKVGANNPPPRFLVFHFYSYKDERVRYTWI